MSGAQGSGGRQRRVSSGYGEDEELPELIDVTAAGLGQVSCDVARGSHQLSETGLQPRRR
jgi:hypothetical protein